MKRLIFILLLLPFLSIGQKKISSYPLAPTVDSNSSFLGTQLTGGAYTDYRFNTRKLVNYLKDSFSTGGGVPGGGSKSVQYDSSGHFAGNSKFIYDPNGTFLVGSAAGYNYLNLQPAIHFWRLGDTVHEFISAFGAGTMNISAQTVYLPQQGETLTFNAGANGAAGTATLSSGTVTISTTAIAAGDHISATYVSPTGTMGTLVGNSITPGVSFKVESRSPTSTVNVADNNTFTWFIVHKP